MVNVTFRIYRWLLMARDNRQSCSGRWLPLLWAAACPAVPRGLCLAGGKGDPSAGVVLGTAQTYSAAAPCSSVLAAR